jgi:molybdopterin synthase catalytic subunit
MLSVVRVGRAAISMDSLARAVRDPKAGAVVVFLGTTRVHNAGRRVLRLEYEAFAGMAEREMEALARQARRRWRVCRVAMAHRTGVVPVGQVSVGVAVSSGHRAEAFAACRWLIDRLKATVPIWKREHFRGGRVWIGTTPAGPRRVAARRVARRRR